MTLIERARKWGEERDEDIALVADAVIECGTAEEFLMRVQGT